ncbi:MAG: RNA polymerase sigma factor [Ruminococcus sp.]
MLSSENFITRAVQQYSDMIYRIAVHITKNSDDAYDVCQDVFLRLIKNQDKIKDDEHLKNWLIRTAINCSKSLYSKSKKHQVVSIDEVDESEFSAVDKQDNTISLVMQLPEKYRIAIYLFYYQEMSISEISNVLDVSVSAVKSRLSRGRKALEKLIRKEDSYE